MKLLQEFKEFAVKGNMIDMAIGIIIGASFNSVIDVLVKNGVLPPLSLRSSGVNVESQKRVLRASEMDSLGNQVIEEVAINYGLFVATFVAFLIVGLTIFMVVKFINKLNKKAEDPTDKSVSTPKNIELLTRTNVLLEEQNKLLKSKLKT